MKDPDLQTRHTVQAHELADAVNAGLSKIFLAPGSYVPELTAPEGPSTGGGVQGMQHLKLVPRNAGYPTLVVGSANHVTGIAELRSFDYVDAVYRERFNGEVPLDRQEYGLFLVSARNLLEVVQLKPRVVEQPPPDPTAARPTAVRVAAGMARGTMVFAIVGVVVTAIVVVAALLAAS